MSDRPAPGLGTLDAHASYLDALLEMMNGNWQDLSGDRSRWPLLLARLHAQAALLTRATQDLADQLARYAAEHPQGELPEHPDTVPVISFAASALAALYDQAGGSTTSLEALLLREHLWRLAGPRPHTIEFSPGEIGKAEAHFRDATGRLALIVLYGCTEADAKQALEFHGVTPALIPFVPQLENTFYAAQVGTDRYDRFGALIAEH